MTALAAFSRLGGIAAVSSTSVPLVLAWSPAVLVAGLVGASVVHALQGGVRGDRGATQEDILGVPAEQATAQDVARLGEQAGER